MKWYTTSGLIMAFFLFSLTSLQAQGSYIHFNHLTTADGLSNSSVNAIYQDRYGFMWFATNEGLNRYDGKHFLVYNAIPGDSASLASGYTYAMTEAPDGTLWVATIVGISCLHPFKGRIENYFVYEHQNSQTLPFSQIGCLGSGEVLGLVTAHHTSEPLLYRADTFTHRLYAVPLPHLKALPEWYWPFNIRLLRNGWIIYQDGIKLFLSTDGAKHFRQINEMNPSPAGVDLSKFMIIDADTAACWFTNNKGVMLCYNYKRLSWKEFSIPRQMSLSEGIAYGDPHCWFSGYTSGLLKMDTVTGHYIRYFHDDQDPWSLSDNTIYGSYVGKEGTLWLATQGGVDYWNEETDNIHCINNKMSGFKQFGGASWGSMAEDDSGRIWLGTVDYSSSRNALFCLNPRTMQYQKYFCHAGKNNYLPVWKILPLDAKHLLLSTQSGLLEFDIQRKICTQKFSLPIPDEIKKFPKGFTILMKDSDGSLWFGLWKNGLIKYNPGTRKTTHFFTGAKNPAHRLQDDWVFDATEDKHHRLWVVSPDDQRLTCIDENSDSVIKEYILHYQRKELTGGLGYLWCDSTGNIWLCTSYGGVICFDPAAGQIKKIYTSSSGLISAINYSFLPDNQQRLWLYTAKGIQCLDTKSGDFYPVYTYLPPPPGSIEGSPMLLSRDGTIYIGYGKNLIYFNPDKILQPYHTVTPSVLSLRKKDETIILSPDTKAIKISHKEDLFQISYASLDMLHSRMMQYSYRLAGYSNRWINKGNEGGAIFTRLPPDHYELQMRAIVPGIPWDGKYSSLMITVVPAFYQTRLFKMAMLILITAALYYLTGRFTRQKYRMQLARLHREQQINNVRNRIAQDIHDDIGAGLTRISIQTELLKQNPATDKSDYQKVLDIINKQTHDLIRSLGEIVWTINPSDDYLDNMLAYFRVYIHRFMEGSGLSYEINFPETECRRNVHPDLKRNLFLILKESLNNIVKHARAHKVIIIFLMRKDDNYILTVQDDGDGFDVEDAATFSGNGLHNMRNRAWAINARVIYRSHAGEGASISIEGGLF